MFRKDASGQLVLGDCRLRLSSWAWRGSDRFVKLLCLSTKWDQLLLKVSADRVCPFYQSHLIVRSILNHLAILFPKHLGHFTQVVWKDSKLLGIAQARSNSGKIIVVANYDPAGNFGGRYQANVFAPE